MSHSDDFYGDGSAFNDSASTMRHPSERPAWVPRPRVPSMSWAAWSIALMPLGVVATNLGIGAVQGFMTWAMIGLTSALLFVLCVIFARVDRRELDAWGFENTTSPWLVLLTPPVYLAVRGNRVWKRTGAGFGPFWASVAAILLAPVVVRGFGVLGSIGDALAGVRSLLGM